jgi:YbbR domain-containing protein
LALKSPFIKSIEPSSRKEKIRLNRKVVTFLCCVFISILFWLLTALSKEYTITLSYPADYVNPPKDKVVSNDLPEKIYIDIRSKGFFLLAYKFKEAKTVYVDLKDSRPLGIKKNNYYLLSNSQINKITGQFSSRIKILNISPDTIFLNFNKKITKLVPVKSNLSIAFDNLYQQTDTTTLAPAFIAISGAADVINKVDHVETKPLVVNNINSSREIAISVINPSRNGDIQMSTSEVKAIVNVKKYTEATIELPIEAVNLPIGYSLKSFPDKVIVKYNVAFDSYDKINAQQFRAIIDYKKAEANSNKLKIILEKYPKEIRAIKLNPEKVEYILKK